MPISLEDLGDFKRTVPLSALELGKVFPIIDTYPLIMNPVSMFQPPFTIGAEAGSLLAGERGIGYGYGE